MIYLIQLIAPTLAAARPVAVVASGLALSIQKDAPMSANPSRTAEANQNERSERACPLGFAEYNSLIAEELHAAEIEYYRQKGEQEVDGEY